MVAPLNPPASSRLRRRGRAARRAAAFLLLATPFASAAAWAHAFPEKSDPRVGATVAKAPPAVRIWFNARLEPLFSKLSVKNAAGRVVSRGPAQVAAGDPSLLVVALPRLSAGTYHVYWSVTSKDGHRTEGDFQFTVTGD